MRNKKQCPKCNGTGRIENPVFVGNEMREKREKTGLSLRKFAEKINFSPAYVSDLENGKRAWGKKAKEAYLKGLK